MAFAVSVVPSWSGEGNSFSISPFRGRLASRYPDLMPASRISATGRLLPVATCISRSFMNREVNAIRIGQRGPAQ